MDNLVEIILQAVDNASDVFAGVSGSAEEMGSSIEGAGDEASASFDNVEAEAEEAGEAIDAMADLMAFQALSEYVNQLADTMWELADKAGTVADSWTRLGLAAEGANIPVDQMKNSVGELSAETGRAGSDIRESFIQMSSAGITSLETMETLFKGASAQSFILGTDVDALANKFSGMAMKSSIAERTLKGTGITVEELGEVLGIQGATIDDVNAKWETMDTDARAAALGQAAAMNEGEEANEAYKQSWEGLNAQVEIAKSKLEVIIGSVLLPVLIPALEAAGNVLSWLGDTLQYVMDSPLGGFISVVGSLGAGLVLLLGGVTAVTAGMGFFTASLWPAVVASWALISPWLPFIAAAALIVAAVYEIGKSFGWWDDASGMVEALSAGVMRLWNAFINHPDVQAFLEALGDAWSNLVTDVTNAWNAVMEFFGINSSSNFDVVRALIDSIGAAWEALKPIVMSFVDIYRSIMTGDIPSLLESLYNLHRVIFTNIGKVGKSLVTVMVNAIVGLLRGLVGRARSALMGVVNSIRAAINAWISAAKERVLSLVNTVYTTLTGLPGKIASALSGVADAITKPFSDAYDAVKPYIDKINQGIDAIGNATGAWAGESADGRTSLLTTGYSVDNKPVTVDHNLNISLDLRNVPQGVDTDTLIGALTDRRVLSALTESSDFQLLDGKAKERLNLKIARSRGI